MGHQRKTETITQEWKQEQIEIETANQKARKAITKHIQQNPGLNVQQVIDGLKKLKKGRTVEELHRLILLMIVDQELELTRDMKLQERTDQVSVFY